MMSASWIKPQRRPNLWNELVQDLDGVRGGEWGMGEGVPVTEHSNEHLSDDDTDDFEICYSRNPVLGADFVGFPTCRPNSLKQRR